MAITTFIPELWSARLLYALEKSHVATNLVNRNYQGQITNVGDTVHINSIGAITVSDYTKNSDMSAPETLATTDQTLVINQAKSFNFQVADVSRRFFFIHGVRDAVAKIASINRTQLFCIPLRCQPSLFQRTNSRLLHSFKDFFGVVGELDVHPSNSFDGFDFRCAEQPDFSRSGFNRNIILAFFDFLCVDHMDDSSRKNRIVFSRYPNTWKIICIFPNINHRIPPLQEQRALLV